MRDLYMKRFGIILGSILGGLYLLFLILPLILSPVLNIYSPQISKMASEASGYKVTLSKLAVITTPKLTVGVKVGHIECAIPSGEKFLSADRVRAKMSLLPILLRRIEADIVSADNVVANLDLRQDGHFLIEEFLPQSDPDKAPQAVSGLPLGFKLSNHLPNIVLKNYEINLVDMADKSKYSINGPKIALTDFILDKKVKFVAKGQFDINSNKAFSYDVKVLNKLMPDLDLNDLVFNSTQSAQSNEGEFFNVLPILRALKTSQLCADLNADINTSGTFKSPEIYGNVDLENISMLVDGKKMPASNVKIKASGSKIVADANLYSAENELTYIHSKLKKAHSISLQVKSNADLGNFVKIVNALATSFGYNDLKTLTANGKIDADFTLKTTKKHVSSKGHCDLPSGSIAYKLYNIAINNINADIDFNDRLDIKNISFEILGQPLKIAGTIKSNSETDLAITANNLLIKGLVVAAGQMHLLKENAFNSGTVSMNATLKGKLAKLQPDLSVVVNNLNVKNIPSATTFVMPSAKFTLVPDGKKYSGNLTTNNIKLINPMATVSVPETEIVVGEKDIDINKAYLLFNNSRIDFTGKVSDYTSDKLKMDIAANGFVLANDINAMLPKEFRVPARGKLPLKASVKGNMSSQTVDFNMAADANNYIALFDIDSLKGHKTVINSSIRIADDSLKFANTGVFVDSLGNPLITLEGAINSLSKSQALNLRLALPKTLSMPVPTMKKSNIVLRGNVDIVGIAANPILKGLVSVPNVSIDDMALKITNSVINLNGAILKGSATVQKLQYGGIVAENLASEFNMKNYTTFYINNILGDAFNGKVSGNVSYGLNNGRITANLAGSGMNAAKAIEGFAGIKNALSGSLSFKTNIVTSGVTDVEIMKNLKGNASFDVIDGKFLNVGRFDNLLYAQNILGNAILKAAVTSVTNLPIIQNTAEFKSITGDLTLSSGWANLKYIKTAGPLMAYYITGKFNLLNGTTNVIILGRVDGKVVSVLGPFGDLSVDKLTSFIPKFGSLTSSLVKAFTSDPENEKTENIPALSGGSTNYRDFKVVFIGGIDSRSSIKSFKWLSKCDTTAIDYKQEFNNATKDLKNTIQGAKQDFSDTKDALKNTIQDSKQQLIDAKEGLKNLFSF